MAGDGALDCWRIAILRGAATMGDRAPDLPEITDQALKIEAPNGRRCVV
jgi:hypothetical protein